jgi:nucleoside-diphosphate-sugar epimerase
MGDCAYAGKARLRLPQLAEGRKNTMRVFVTGAAGWVGSAVVRELLGAGHQVLGLVRSEDGARALRDAGAEAQTGDLEDLGGLGRAAAACEGVIHTAFGHDFSRFQESAELDRRAIEAMGEALAGTERPLVTTSGTLMLGFTAPGRLGLEQDAPPAAVPRVASELATLSLAERGVRSSVVRLPPSVHGMGDRGFVPRIIDIARERGVSAYIGEGMNRWPTVPRLDAARAFRLALELGEAGSRFHVVAEEGVPLRELAKAIGRKLKTPATSISPEEAGQHFGFLAMFLGLDAPASSALTRQRLGWTPTGPSLIEDLEEGAYFGGGASKYSGRDSQREVMMLAASTS